MNRRDRSSWISVAERRWPRAEWITGDGPFALLAKCGCLSVTLHATREQAERAKATIDRTGCGSRCTVDIMGADRGNRHEIVVLEEPARVL